MENSLGYFLLCRVWQRLLESNEFDSLNTITSLKMALIDDGIPCEQFMLADNAFRWTKGFDLQGVRQ